MSDVPTTEPAKLRAGETWEWRREDLTDDYPASSWTLTYRFKNAAGGFEIAATADGDYFAISVDATTTGAYTSGLYSWVAQASSGSEKHIVNEGVLEVLPNLFATSASTGVDTRSHARIMLDTIEAALEAFNLGAKSYTIGTRSLTKYDVPELLVMRQRYAAEVKAEEAAIALERGEAKPRRWQVRF